MWAAAARGNCGTGVPSPAPPTYNATDTRAAVSDVRRIAPVVCRK